MLFSYEVDLCYKGETPEFCFGDCIGVAPTHLSFTNKLFIKWIILQGGWEKEFTTLEYNQMSLGRKKK